MFIRNERTTLDGYWKQTFDLYKSDITYLLTQWWNQEDIKDKSAIQYKVMQYYLAYYYVALIYMKVNRGFEGDWAAIESNYDMTSIRQSLSCNGIKLEDILDIFGLNANTVNSGIEVMQVESTLVVETTEGGTVYTATTFIDTLLANPKGCECFIN